MTTLILNKNFPFAIINIISEFNNDRSDIKLLLRLLSKSFNNLYTDHRSILESSNKYFRKLQHAKKVISRCISIENDTTVKSKRFTIEEFKTLSNRYEKIINKSIALLMKNKALVINNYGEDTLIYYSSRTGELIKEAYGEDNVDITYICADEKRTINKYMLKNYEIYNDRIYFLLITGTYLGNRYGKPVSLIEANALAKAFKSRVYY